ncbi:MULTISPECIES: UDP-glucose--hexose-1-phosphate uridylyltransferase [unclassified Paenibacillus]|uniref:UDP-glucose--hexose-1-phosphate uridylyltransferase n=1 Tax=unclassified Paenibacillus TaxID=185978 RepID=UPI002407584E|nr:MULTISPECIES: UDP-glucose--hexose-1-phosphate uridylyltransferase [unclassified Paenibacillus]MDF9843875.1 UDPglucose--hexose-1-phosphate uridylyltransferase [Paenibacillus sp. PastF-2]MDF9850441.1 UDPglucose--hexose-1-phosphate uridylyltransferase [Paenibacillus sp. PastM-2]MDF9857054.1 UDPglucose--hexose-1-phosphate uridylyltransferase [Paenibacillus sp. PastF-1]MDH6482326.1 UDPglucose--hexose-1-phosphate uridylyltransferase [Paenibacillus sp. PastH-2]MDH6509707.1 UDPglucose--hexose-1-pho
MSNDNTAAPAAEKALYAIEQLVLFAQHQQLIQPADVDYSRNELLDQFGFSEPYAGAFSEAPLESPQAPLDALIDYGFTIGLIPENTDTYRDLLDAKIMGLLMARPSEVNAEFKSLAAEQGIAAATDRFYKLSIDSNYIRMDRVAKNVYWLQDSPYGNIEMTINLSKPEKSPKEIAMARLLPPPVYPKCQLCRENVGYAGRVNHPPRQNLRIIPLELNKEKWFFQYSPYVYYNEHCIVFHHDHVPMKLTKDTLKRLLSFVESFPHYFIGSNADLPIVGGSILTHDHFQGGRHTFPIQKAPKEVSYNHPAYPGVSLSIVKWPMSVLRLGGNDPAVLLECGNALYEAWKGYSDPEADVLAFSDVEGVQTPHNTVTPIVRRSEDGGFEMDLVLRNNRTSEEYPEGIFHPHREMHHIKKENIGLIEVMGLAILPGRLKEELDAVAGILAGDQALLEAVKTEEGHALALHAFWIDELVERFGTGLAREEAVKTVQNEVGIKFTHILEHAGVYKRTPEGQAAFRRFVQSFGAQ